MRKGQLEAQLEQTMLAKSPPPTTKAEAAPKAPAKPPATTAPPAKPQGPKATGTGNGSAK